LLAALLVMTVKLCAVLYYTGTVTNSCILLLATLVCCLQI